MDNLKGILTDIGLRIKTYRKDRKLTQIQLSNMTGISEKYISRLERGEENITIRTLFKISNSLNIKLEDLFKGLEEYLKDDHNLIINEITSTLKDRNIKEQEMFLSIVKLIISEKE